MKNNRVRQFLNDFKSISYCCRKIIELNLELEELNYIILGMSHNSPRLTKQQEKSSLPMPTYQRTFTSPLALMEEISIKEYEVNYYRRRILECKPIELLSLQDQNILFDLYFFGINSWDVAEKYGYTKRGMYKHINNEIGKLI